MKAIDTRGTHSHSILSAERSEAYQLDCDVYQSKVCSLFTLYTGKHLYQFCTFQAAQSPLTKYTSTACVVASSIKSCNFIKTSSASTPPSRGKAFDDKVRCDVDNRLLPAGVASSRNRKRFSRRSRFWVREKATSWMPTHLNQSDEAIPITRTYLKSQRFIVICHIRRRLPRRHLPIVFGHRLPMLRRLLISSTGRLPRT